MGLAGIEKHKELFATGLISTNVVGFTIMVLTIISNAYIVEMIIFSCVAFMMSLVFIYLLSYNQPTRFRFLSKSYEDLR